MAPRSRARRAAIFRLENDRARTRLASRAARWKTESAAPLPERMTSPSMRRASRFEDLTFQAERVEFFEILRESDSTSVRDGNQVRDRAESA